LTPAPGLNDYIAQEIELFWFVA